MKNYELPEYIDPVTYSDCVTDNFDLLSSILGEEGDDWVRWFLTPAFFRPWHWN